MVFFRYLESKLHQSDSNLSLILNENTTLKQRLQSYEQTEHIIREMIFKFSNTSHYDDLFKTINKTLAIYEQRLGYINKRFLVLQTLFNRQLLTLASKQHVHMAIQTDDEQYVDLTLMERELQTVSHERDLLAHKLHQENEQVRMQTEQLEQRYQRELLVNQEKFVVMQVNFEENQRKIEFYENTLVEKEKQLKELTEKWMTEQQKQTANTDLFKREFQVKMFISLRNSKTEIDFLGTRRSVTQ